MNDEAPQHLAEQDHLLGNQAYDILKWIALILLPALGTLYFAFAQIWGLDYGPEVVGSIVAFDTFLGAVLQLSTKSYNKSDAKYDGVIDVSETEDGIKQATLQLKRYENPADVVNQKQVLFKVNPPK
jgi:hypothetical protein